jgi:TolB protein
MPAALLAYVYGDVGAADIHVYDRASARTWTVASRACDEAEPDWLPDGRSVVYQADCDGGYDLYQVDVETRAVRRLTATPGENEREPDVSPDGGWLVYRTNREANARNLDGALHLINLGGGAPQPLGVAGRSPTWSPDGTQLLFMSERESNWEIYVYSLVDHSTRRLTNCDANCRFPTWSPDGQWVAYHSTTGPDTADAETIWRIPAGGGESALLVTGSGAGRPTWSVGGWIAFNSQQGIELVDERGEQRRILLASSSHWAPAWSR